MNIPDSAPSARLIDARVLVVGDDPRMVNLMRSMLRSAGYSVRWAQSGRDAATAVDRWVPDLMVQDGFDVTQYLHGEYRATPAIFLTPKQQLMHSVPGLVFGGGSYLLKPFSSEELNGRVRRALRRTKPQAMGEQGANIMRLADLELDDDTDSFHRAGRLLRLTPTEFLLLRYLIRNAGATLTWTDLLDHVWHYEYKRDAQVVRTYISRLRRKVDHGAPPLIHVLRGVGCYSLRPSVECDVSPKAGHMTAEGTACS